MKARKCMVCGKFHPTKSKSENYVCSRGCRAVLALEKQRENETLCWSCQNVTKCCWKDKIPVKGWDAIPHTVDDEEGEIRTYRVIKCPNYLEDEIRGEHI